MTKPGLQRHDAKLLVLRHLLPNTLSFGVSSAIQLRESTGIPYKLSSQFILLSYNFKLSSRPLTFNGLRSVTCVYRSAVLTAPVTQKAPGADAYGRAKTTGA